MTEEKTLSIKDITTVENILARLISFQVLGGQSNLPILEFIESYLTAHGVQYHLVPHPTEAKKSLHCRIGPSVDGGVILSGHMDVVPVKGQAWDTNPFELVEKDGKLFGRGTCDMKGFLACCLAVVPEMVKAPLKTPIYLAFSYDEEIGCLAGPALVEHIRNTYTENPRFAIIGEPSLLQPIIGQKGICVLKTTLNGSAGHSSRIRQEVSAIHEAAKLINWLENKMIQLAAEDTDDRFHPNHSSIHIGKINGGIAPNVICDSCTFYWDIRNIPKNSIESIKSDFAVYCKEVEIQNRKKFPAFSIETVEDHPPVPPLDTKESDEVVTLCRKITEVQEVDTVAYAAEAGQFSNGGFQSIICGPGSIEQAHRANEFIAIEQLHKGVKMLQRLVSECSK